MKYTNPYKSFFLFIDMNIKYGLVVSKYIINIHYGIRRVLEYSIILNEVKREVICLKRKLYLHHNFEHLKWKLNLLTVISILLWRLVRFYNCYKLHHN